MSYRKKKKEAKEDLSRYFDILQDIEDMEDRDFFIRGIINIDLKYRNERIFRKIKVEKIRKQINESVYNLEAIANFCTVGLKDIKDIVEGKLPPSKTIKKIYVGLKAYEV